jgi:hypothetical protein
MTLLLPALSLAFASFCVWLTVRIVNRRERWAKWTAAGVAGVPLLYIASFGPACWWFSHDSYVHGIRVAPRIYWPLGRASISLPQPIMGAVSRYAMLGVDAMILGFGNETFPVGFVKDD